MTTYVILEGYSGSTGSTESLAQWTVVARGVEASSAKGAIRKHARESMAAEGGNVTEEPRRFVAVPERSWREHLSRVEVQRHLWVS